ncbi:MAG: hypothetical protein IPK85_17260 [Gemmatimonadetes bacterium]|nr:hypothetical protein [Gemmatimonadota bacterium]
MTQFDDATLRAAYAGRRDPHVARVPVETVEALARGTYVGADREHLLEQVLRDPGQSREFHFFHDVGVSAAPAVRRAWWHGTRGLALAAGGVLAVALGSRYLGSPGPEEGPMRGAGAGVMVWGPADAMAVDAAEGPVTFAWRPIAGARDYELTITGDDGAERLRRAVTDTVLTLVVPPGATAWWVTARHADGSSRQSEIRSLVVR